MFPFPPRQNCIEATYRLCNTLGVKITHTTISKELLLHPDYPSLLSISDVLSNYSIENVTVKIGVHKIRELPVPFIAQIRHKQRTEVFVVIEDADDVDKFKDIFTGYVLIPDAEDAVREPNYNRLRREERVRYISNGIIIIVIPVLLLILIAGAIISNGIRAMAFPVIFSLLSFTGVIFTILLLSHQVESHNPLLQKICKVGKKVNCGEILDSPASKILGISWSVIGFSYFMGVILSFLSAGIFNNQVWFLLFCINVPAILFVPYSLYYQWRIAKQWCVLCLFVQMLLILQFATAITCETYLLSSFRKVPLSSYILVASNFSVAYIAISLLMPALQKAKEAHTSKMEIRKLKNNPRVFAAILSEQRPVTQTTEGMGIIVGNPLATHKIIKVCNPYCVPCCQSHPVVEKLLHSRDDIQLQIIFTASGEEIDERTAPAQHLLAIDSKYDKAIVKKALDDWYNAPVKDYNSFARKYPVNGELRQQNGRLKEMNAWCDELKIDITPTFFINGHQLPATYSIEDLKYVLPFEAKQ